jgi:bifunctional non-homologous end joining protein LigD
MRFVVHEHHARRLHWDLRLERDGALMSWAVPNGIPQDPSENRKAIHVEDHPLSYIDFEGEIPAGSYGAGKVLIWDRGRYDCEKLEDGKLVVVFHGERLRGRYALFRTGGEKDWMIHRMDSPVHPREAMPEHLPPMLASPGRLPENDEGWAFEIKWDGVRAITYWRPGRMRIESRNRNDVSSRYPELRALGRQLGAREAVLDGEIVAFDEQGKPSFGRLQRRMHLSSESAIRRLSGEAPATYVIFDLLYLEGHLTVGLSYRDRRKLLQQLDLNGASWQTPAYHEGDGRAFQAVAAEHGLEGILAKRLDAPYQPGERSEEWLKIKNKHRQELVIGGWLEGKGNRAGRFGALLVGYYEGKGKRRSLRYAGRVGTGFDEAELERLTAALTARRRRSSPFGKDGVQPPRDARFVKPELVAEIEFSGWTHDRILRHSSYKGLRSDKPAREVELEMPAVSVTPNRKEPRQDSPPRNAVPQKAPPQDAPRRVLAEAEPSGWRAPYEVLHRTKRYTEIEVDGRRLRLSNRDKVLYPDAGFTKGQTVDYYAAVAPVLLAHLAGRPLTLKRYPDGVQGEFFYEKRCPAHRPEWVHTEPIWSERIKERIDYCLVEDLPTLLWVANLAGIELHTSLSRARTMEVPTALVFDLDPGAPAGLRECCRVALWIKELFDALGLRTFAKTSGAKGLQVYAPLNTPVSYEQTKPFARAVAQVLEQEHPKLALSRMSKSLRPGRVLIDWSQNDPHKTTVCVYSLRARERPTISTPLTWEEVARASRRRREPALSLEPEALLERVERHGDLFAPLLSLTQTLPDLSNQDAGEQTLDGR